MGYTTQFSGVLKFGNELNINELKAINEFLGEDTRDHPEWKINDDYVHIDLELTEDYSGIKWDGSEKNYGMVEAINLIIREMKKINAGFKLSGKFDAQGEEIGDCWALVIGDDGFAHRSETPPVGEKIRCPLCEKYFFYEGK
jgi:hypothetical protein